MAWRDRLRRRAAVPEAATAAPVARNTAAARETGVPGDWDGGWRMTAPPALTVSRAAIGVSDGLAFRSGLAAWRDPSFDTGLAHALLPSAPAGLVHGVTRPAGPRTSASGGGPLLLRALRQPHEAEPSGAGDTPQISRRVRPDAAPSGATPPRPGGPGTDPVVSGPAASVPDSVPPSPSRGGASTHAVAVRGTPAPAVQRAGATGSGAAVPPAAPGPAPKPPRFPLVRRIAVVPDASTARAASAGASAPAPSGPPVQRVATGSSSAPAAAGVRPRAVGRTLTVARVPATPRRRVPAVRPAPAHTTTSAPVAPVQSAGGRAPLGTPVTELPPTAPPSGHPATAPAPAPALPVLQRRAEPAPEGAAATTSTGQSAHAATPGGPGPQHRTEKPAASTPAPVRRAGSRPPLGAPLSEVPATAAPSDRPASAPAPAPAMPMVQRRAEPPAAGAAAPDTKGAKPSPQDRAEEPAASTPLMARPSADPDAPVQRAQTRAPLGTPAAELPLAAAPSDHPPTAPAPTPALPVVQRQAEPSAGADTPVQRAGSRPPLGTPRAELPATATPPDRQAAPPARGAAPPDSSGPEPAAGAEAAVQRARTRAPLGAPLTELPATAVPSGRPAPAPAPAPAMPVVQRQTEPAAGPQADRGSGPGRPTPRVRTGLGAPLPALPPSAAPPASASSRARAARPASPADVQRAPVPGAPALPTDHAPVLGAASAARRAPLTGGPGAPPGAAHPVPLVVARQVTDPSTAPHLTGDTTASRTLQLLAARPLPLGTRDMGSAAGPAARPASRPVVPARWSAPPTPHAAPPQVQRAAMAGPRGTTPPPAVRPVRAVHAVRPAAPAAPTRAAATPLPVTGPHAPPLVVQPAPAASPAQPVPVVRPRTPPPAAAPVATGPAPPAPVQRTPGGPRTGPGPAGSAGPAPADRHTAPQVPDSDLDDLARRLLDPVSRLLRTELRRGRERAGRPFDGRR
ncbi:hypothetical protein ACGFZK_30650 [Streptomyces sp. NPDC048257]|uniref:hypothetical protein n=1 Tax=Streptomyces sp. NPDC048257 TaxID=3365526 RepID=UPI00371BC30E